MKSHGRREFIKLAGIAGAGMVAMPLEGAAASTFVPNQEELGMLYDATQCVGCKACMSACKRVNGDYGSLSFEKARFDEEGLWDAPEDLSGNTRTLIKLFKDEYRWSYVKYSCMHCQKPSCVSACPVSAMTKDPITGVIHYSKGTCIGCRYCQVACAFNIPRFQWDKALPQIVKCDFCSETNLKQKGLPACAETCPTGAILFGKRKDLLAEAKSRIHQTPDRYDPQVYGESEVGGTNHLLLAGIPFERLGLPSLPEQPPAELSEKIQHTIYKGFVAPVALYGVLCFIAQRNLKKLHKHPHPPHPEKKGH
jgi:Fe-S-cluster-containing dehydrogenase component